MIYLILHVKTGILMSVDGTTQPLWETDDIGWWPKGMSIKKLAQQRHPGNLGVKAEIHPNKP